MTPEKKPVLVIAGPTASGKSGLALEIAQRRNGIVINADSMQIYEGLPILTAQPSPEDEAVAPHALYRTLRPDDVCSAARWRDMALREINQAHSLDLLPIITGGTGFYLKTLIEGISPIPDIPPETRTRISLQQKQLGNPAFHAELKKRDPQTASRLDSSNTQRLVRAMEVLEHTGQSLAKWQEKPREKPPWHLEFFILLLLPQRESLYRNCDGRFEGMLKKGAETEARIFLKKMEDGIVSKTAPLAKALGFSEFVELVEGRTSHAEAVEAIKLSTRHYAKRQVTWFRHQLKADLNLEHPDSQRVVDALKF